MTSGMNISIADAVRHLIVCDTQFTWAGVTNLTLEQMMDLQARGWVVEGDDNDEFQLTDAGESVVARALQHGVPKTLTDVQPGGRVRLGDQAERARFEAWPQAREFEIQKDGSGEYLSEVTHGAWLAWKYLSAQPSPGGQGDAPECAKRAMYDEVWNALNAAGFGDDLASSIAALAARQPVGEPVGRVRTRVDGGFIAELLPGVADRLSNMAPLYLHQPAQAVDLGQFRPSVKGALIRMGQEQDTESAIHKRDLQRLLALIDSHGARHG